MRKILLFFTFFCFLTFSSHVYAKELQSQPSKDEQLSNDENVVINENPIVLDEYQICLQNQLTKLPSFLLVDLINKGWVITFSDENLSEKYFAGQYEKVIGLTMCNPHMIVLDKNIKSIEKSALHEIGHSIAFTYHRPDKTQHFIDIYNLEKNNFNPSYGNKSYCIISPVEYFAAAFQECIVNPTNMQINNPMTYGYIMTFVYNLENVN